MNLYFYKTDDKTIVDVFKNVLSYTDNEVRVLAESGNEGIYSPFADGYELSSKEDCSETLRADYRNRPTREDTVEAQVTYTAMMTDTLLEES